MLYCIYIGTMQVIKSSFLYMVVSLCINVVVGEYSKGEEWGECEKGRVVWTQTTGGTHNNISACDGGGAHRDKILVG